MAKQVSNSIVQANQLVPCWWDGENTASTLTKSNASGAQRMPDKDNFGAVLQPLPFVKAKRAQSSTDDEGWVKGVVAPTQNAFDVGDTRATTAILFENHPNDSRVTGPHDVAPSCVSRYGTGGGNVPLVIPIQDSRVIEKNQNGIGVGNETSPAYTIDQTGALATESGMKQQNYLASTTMQVRRLTPTECERLQGFPDGWTAIPWKKKLADDCPDGPRYKALGNSMAVNCMEWIGERINAIQTQS